jgi:alpha-L-fucosidase
MSTWTVVVELQDAEDEDDLSVVKLEQIEAESSKQAVEMWMDRHMSTIYDNPRRVLVFGGEGSDMASAIAQRRHKNMANYRAHNAAKLEADERAEYERLRAKFGGT